jgi:predicted RNase H-like nuclease (RuvC/YqgF family)
VYYWFLLFSDPFSICSLATGASGTRQEKLRKDVHHPGRSSEQQQGQTDQLNAQVTQDRSMAKDNDRQSHAHSHQMTDHEKIRKLEEENKRLQQLNAKLTGEISMAEDTVRQLTEEVRKTKEVNRSE